MNPTENAIKLGTEQGREAAEAWCHANPEQIDSMVRECRDESDYFFPDAVVDCLADWDSDAPGRPPRPTFAPAEVWAECGAEITVRGDGEVLYPDHVTDAYERAYYSAVERVVRARCQEVAI